MKLLLGIVAKEHTFPQSIDQRMAFGKLRFSLPSADESSHEIPADTLLAALEATESDRPAISKLSMNPLERSRAELGAMVGKDFPDRRPIINAPIANRIVQKWRDQSGRAIKTVHMEKNDAPYRGRISPSYSLTPRSTKCGASIRPEDKWGNRAQKEGSRRIAP